MVNQLQAVAIATRFLVVEVPDAVFCEVWATQHAGEWLVSFGQVFPPNVVESPGGWAVAVNVETGAGPAAGRPAAPGGPGRQASRNRTVPARPSPGSSTRTPVPSTPRSNRLKPSLALLTGSTQTKSWPGGT